MLCNICNERDAMLLVQQVSIGGKKEIHLCPQCAKSRGIDVAETKIGSSIETLINSVSMNTRCCYVCGKSYNDIKKSGLLGCPECYIAFNEEIKTQLIKKGAGLPYTGSMPKKLAHFRSMLTDRIEIQKKLDDSVEHENFEKAAMYRDFLKTLDRSSVASGEEGGLFEE